VPDKGLQILCADTEDANELVILNNSDIVGYKWENHEIIINDEAANKIQNLNVGCKRFAIYLNGKKLIEGDFESAVKSGIGIKCPSILVTPEETHSIVADNSRIKIWYFGNKPDPRENSELKNYLEKENLLK
jgi:hypothetical protein